MIRVFAVLTVAPALLLAQANPLDSAVDRVRRGHPAEAQTILTEELRIHPNNPEVIALLAVVDDQLQNFADAERLYTRASVLAPNDAALLNNYGNHLVATGKSVDAARKFRRVLELAPGHVNARTQLAALALQDRNTALAERYLSPLPPEARKSPRVALLEMQLSYEQGKQQQGDAINDRLTREANGEVEALLPLGAALSACGQYGRAGALFSGLSLSHPSDPRIAYYLGLTESKMGHNETALSALKQAQSLDPKNAAILYDLAVVQRNLDDRPGALESLGSAARLEPGRVDVQRLLAQTLLEAGFYSDAVTVLDEYLKLQPQDAKARRDRAYAESALGHDSVRSLAELEAFVRTNPSDSTGYFELAMAQSAADLKLAETSLDKALAKQPDFAAAHMARGMLLHKQGEDERAAQDFATVLRVDPRNARAMQHLAQCYTGLNRNQDALNLLHKAQQTAPDDPIVALALGQALLRSGDAEQATQVLRRARELRSAKPEIGDGLLAFLKLTPEQRDARYRAGVERTARQEPSNIEAQVRYLQILPESDRNKTASHILELNPSAATLAEAAAGLLSAEEPDVATARILIAYGVRQYPADPNLSALSDAAAQLGSHVPEHAAVASARITQ